MTEDNPQAEYWKRVWNNALANMPWKLTAAKCRAVQSGSRATLMRVLGLDCTKSNPKHINYRDYHIVYEGFSQGKPPKDPEVRRKLEICAGPYGRMMTWIKLKELGIAKNYEEPR